MKSFIKLAYFCSMCCQECPCQFKKLSDMEFSKMASDWLAAKLPATHKPCMKFFVSFRWPNIILSLLVGWCMQETMVTSCKSVVKMIMLSCCLYCVQHFDMDKIFMPPPLGAGGIMFSGCPSVRPSVRPKPEIPSFDLHMGPLVHPTNRNRFTACPSVRPSVRPSGEVSGHLPENAWRE